MEHTGAGLKHQRRSADGKVINHNEWYQRGQFAAPAVKKYRKGACENCGAMSHKVKDCLERPRAKGAKFTGQDIRPDELIQEVDLDYDGKHDRWNGYDASEYKKRIEAFERSEAVRRQKKEAELAAGKAEKLLDGGNQLGDDGDDARSGSDSDSDAESGACAVQCGALWDSLRDTERQSGRRD